MIIIPLLLSIVVTWFIYVIIKKIIHMYQFWILYKLRWHFTKWAVITRSHCWIHTHIAYLKKDIEEIERIEADQTFYKEFCEYKSALSGYIFANNTS